MTINLEKSMDIQAPIADVFALWADVQARPGLLPNGLGSQLELTENIAEERLSWRVKGPEVSSTATVQFEAIGEDDAHTKVTLSAHYPNGIGHTGHVADITADMEASLASLNGLLNGAAIPSTFESLAEEPLKGQNHQEVTNTAAGLHDSLSAATEAWAASVNRSFQLLSALAWLPFQGSAFWRMAQAGTKEPSQS